MHKIMVNCLYNYIGIVGCDAPLPAVPVDDNNEETPPEDVFSGLYINQLPGISMKSIEKLADSEQENYLGVWHDVQTRALLKFGVGFRAKMSISYNLKTETVLDCLICSNKALFSVALWYLLGCELMIERTATDRLNRYTTIDLEKAETLKADFYAEYLAAFGDAIGALDVKGSDCYNGCLECVGSNIKFVEALP